MNHVDTLLNFAWAILCIGALARHAWRERTSSSVRTRRVKILRAVSVFMVALLLFPCISISDDYARARLQPSVCCAPNPTISSGVSNSTNILLATQLEETEHIRPVVPFVLVLVLCCLLAIFLETSDSRSPMRWGTLGRAPPVFSPSPAF